MSEYSQIVDMLVGMGIELPKARHAAARYGSVERAASWCFEEGADWTPEVERAMFGPPAPPFIDAPLAPTGDGTLADPVDLTHLGPSPPHTGPPVDGGAIDDDDEEAQLRRALAQSIEDNATATGGSRSPVPGTAGEANGLVPTGQNAVTLPGYSAAGWDVDSASLEEKQMAEAMMASFHGSLAESDTVYVAREAGVRQPGAPVALYDPDPSTAYATTLVQALLACRSFRQVLTLSYPSPIPAPASPSELVWLAQSLNEAAWDEMLALATEVEREEAEEGGSEFVSVGGKGEERGSLWPAGERNIAPEGPGSAWYERLDELTSKALGVASIPTDAELSPSVRNVLTPEPDPLRFFNLKSVQPLDPSVPSTTWAKSLTHCASAQHNSFHKARERDLWSAPFAREDDPKWAIKGKGPVVIAEFVTWPKTVPYGGRVTYELEEKVYADRYLERNFQAVWRLRAEEGVLKIDEDDLLSRRSKLTTVKGQDVRAHLVKAVQYYETLAKPVEDVVLQERAERSLAKLKTVLAELDAELLRLDERLAEVRARKENLFNTPDLLKCPYELRAVLLHNGLFNADSLYAYVKHAGRWWRVSDGASTAVEWADVKADQTGLHLSAGPWGLVYERGDEWVDDGEEERVSGNEEDASQPMDEDPFLSSAPLSPVPALNPPSPPPSDADNALGQPSTVEVKEVAEEDATADMDLL